MQLTPLTSWLKDLSAKKVAIIYADSAYDGLMIIAKAVENTDGTVGQVRDYLRNKLVYEGYSGRFDFNENGDTQKTIFTVKAFNP